MLFPEIKRRGGQIAVLLTLILALVFLLIAVTENINKLAQSKLRVSNAADAGSLAIASSLNSWGWYLSCTYVTPCGNDEECESWWSVILQIVLIVLAVLTAQPAIIGWIAAGLFILNQAVFEPAAMAAANRDLMKLSQQQRFAESAIGSAMLGSGLVDDTTKIPDFRDDDEDGETGSWGIDPEGNKVIAGDKITKFSVWYRQRVRDLLYREKQNLLDPVYNPTGISTTQIVADFQNQLQNTFDASGLVDFLTKQITPPLFRFWNNTAKSRHTIYYIDEVLNLTDFSFWEKSTYALGPCSLYISASASAPTFASLLPPSGRASLATLESVDKPDDEIDLVIAGLQSGLCNPPLPDAVEGYIAYVFGSPPLYNDGLVDIPAAVLAATFSLTGEGALGELYDLECLSFNAPGCSQGEIPYYVMLGLIRSQIEGWVKEINTFKDGVDTSLNPIIQDDCSLPTAPANCITKTELNALLDNLVSQFTTYNTQIKNLQAQIEDFFAAMQAVTNPTSASFTRTAIYGWKDKIVAGQKGGAAQYEEKVHFVRVTVTRFSLPYVKTIKKCLRNCVVLRDNTGYVGVEVTKFDEPSVLRFPGSDILWWKLRYQRGGPNTQGQWAIAVGGAVKSVTTSELYETWYNNAIGSADIKVRMGANVDPDLNTFLSFYGISTRSCTYYTHNASSVSKVTKGNCTWN